MAAIEAEVVPEAAVTTGHRTHRYLRLSLVFLVIMLLASVALQTIVVSWAPFSMGWELLPSISHYFYTPVRNVLVGTLIGASVAMLALAGRDKSATWLDLAAIFGPLIALVPTGIDPERPEVQGLSCPGPEDCIPPQFLGDMRVGVATYAVVVIMVVTSMAMIRRKKRIRSRSALLISSVAVITALVMVVLCFVPGVNANFPFNFWPFPRSIHFAATLLFFGAFAAVPLLRATEAPEPNEKPPTRRQAALYRWVTWLMAADLLLLVVAFFFRDAFGAFPVVLIGEAVALVLFAVFWWVQTFQRWDEVDQRSFSH